MTKHEILQELIRKYDRASKNASMIDNNDSLRSYYSGIAAGIMEAIWLTEDLKETGKSEKNDEFVHLV